MSKSRKSLNKPRNVAAEKQRGKCYYCEQPMWTGNPELFAEKYSISLRQAKRFQCTGEHLIPHKDGGGLKQRNIVAACLYCNQRRHRRKAELNPSDYSDLVRKRLKMGRWHCSILIAWKPDSIFYKFDSRVL